VGADDRFLVSWMRCRRDPRKTPPPLVMCEADVQDVLEEKPARQILGWILCALLSRPQDGGRKRWRKGKKTDER